MPARHKSPEPALDVLPKLFDAAQTSVASHQRGWVALWKVHRDSVNKKTSKEFEVAFIQMLARSLTAKKGAREADRVGRFIGGYIKFVNERADEEKKADDDEETPASLLTERLLAFLLKGFEAKDKSARFRCVKVVADSVEHLGALDETLYKSLRSALLSRLNDKEVGVRVCAVQALFPLVGTDEIDGSDNDEISDDDEDDTAEGKKRTVLGAMIRTLSADASAEVRRAALQYLHITPTSLPAILSRTRDIDVGVRKAVYATLEKNIWLPLKSSEQQPKEEEEDDITADEKNVNHNKKTRNHESQVPGPSHPRYMSIAQREVVVRNGLGDRERAVKDKAVSLLSAWAAVTETKGGDASDNLIAFLDLFDLREAEGKIAADALTCVLEAGEGGDLAFNDEYFSTLTPEKSFLARVFVDFALKSEVGGGEELIERAGIPVVTRWAFGVQEQFNRLVSSQPLSEDQDEETREREEEERMDQEFVLAEMLKLAVNLDYADEIGRRKMFGLVRDMLSHPTLPEMLVPPCLDVLGKVLSSNERDLIRVVVEIVQDLRDPEPEGEEEEEEKLNPDATNADEDAEGSEPALSARPQRVFRTRVVEEDMSPEEKRRRDAIDMKCLGLCIGMLERVNSSFEENSTLDGVLKELIIPSVKRKEIEFREKGLISLGLCCLITRRLALESLKLFLHQVEASPEVLRATILQTVFDMLMVHEGVILGQGGETAGKITEFLIARLGNETSEKVQAILSIGLAKLVLSGMVTDEQAIKNLIMAYLSPTTLDNQELRQCLAYFVPVYSHSSSANQKVMREIFIDMFEEVSRRRKILEEDEEMVTLAQAGGMWIEWTDPLQVVDTQGKVGEAGDKCIQFDMASDIVKALFDTKMDKEDKKALCQILPKLYIPDTIDDNKLRTLKLLMHTLRSRRPLRDTTSNNALTKFETAISKKFEKQLEEFDEEEYRKMEELQELFKFLDDVVPEDDDEVIDLDGPKKKGRKRRSDSMISAVSGEGEPSPSESKRGKSKAKSKRRRLSTSDDEDEDSSDEESFQSPPSTAPTRTLPKRSAAMKKPPPEVIVISSDDGEDDDDADEDEDSEATPIPKRRSRPNAARSKKIKEEARVDDLFDEDEETSGEIPHDSIMDEDDEDDEDEEEEVSGLLAED